MNKKYGVIYADPPWEGATMNLSKKSIIKKEGSFHYNSMKLKDICTLPVEDIAEDNCLLFLWVRSPTLHWGIEVGKAWGFKYATVAFVWDKQRILPGSYTLSQCEMCLVFKKGKIPTNRGGRNVKQFLSEKRARHSEKPAELRRRIEDMFPRQKKIELFARHKTKGWDIWGNELSNDINL